MKKFNKYLIILLSIIILFACKKEFLDYKPIALDTTESYYTSFDALDYTATAAYGILCSRDVYDIMYTIGFQSPCDDSEVGGENVNDWPEFQRMDRLTHTANEAIVHRLWAYPYKGIRMTNVFFEKAEIIREIEIGKLRSEDDIAYMNELIDRRTAEMRFLRAFYHFTLMQVYGGIPIVDKTVDPESFSMPRNSVAEVLHFVQNDLELAIPYLLTKEAVAPDYGRATVGAAQALLGKAYLYESSYAENYTDDSRFDGCENKYDLALQNLKTVIDSGEYDLVGINGERFPSWRVPTGQTIGGFRWIFTLDGDNSGESVWSIQNVRDGAGWTESRGNYMTVYTTIRFCYDEDGDPGKTAGGWSFNLPTDYLINAFGNNDTRETGLSSTPADPTLDPRFSTTIGQAGDSILVDEPGSNDKWYEMDFQNLPTETISRKYECSPAEYWADMVDFHDGPMNIRLIRYADVILMAAEAAYKTGDNVTALNYVNMVRTRARMSGDTGYPLDLPAVTFEDIVHERRLELAMEQSRFFDLIRWDLADDFINGITLASMGEGFTVVFEKGKHEFYPIPTRELQNSPGLQQYDAWK